MRKQAGKTQGDLVLDDDVELVGVVTGTVIVKAGATAQLRGLIVGCLVVESGAVVGLRGMVCGDVRNHGELRVHGTIGGRLLKLEGTAVVEPDAYIGRE